MLRSVTLLTGILGCLFLGQAAAGGYGDWGGKPAWGFPDRHAHGDFDERGLTFTARLTGAQEVTGQSSGVDTDRTARAFVQFDKGFTEVRVRVAFNDSEGVVAAHFHCAMAGQNGPVALGLISPGPLALEGDMIRGTLTNADFSGADCASVVGRPVNNLAALALAMREGLVYLNVHTPDNPAGEIRGQLLER